MMICPVAGAIGTLLEILIRNENTVSIKAVLSLGIFALSLAFLLWILVSLSPVLIPLIEGTYPTFASLYIVSLDGPIVNALMWSGVGSLGLLALQVITEDSDPNGVSWFILLVVKLLLVVFVLDGAFWFYEYIVGLLS